MLLLIGPLLFLAVTIASHGIALIVLLVWAAFASSRARQARALLRGSGLKVGVDQFPEIYRSAQAMSGRLGMAQCPDIYILEDSSQNAFALKQGSERFVILIDDIVFGAISTGNPKVLDFILGHELAHHALGHTNWLRSYISSNYYTLSRLDELSCDGVALALVEDLAVAHDALCLLLVGPQLFPSVNRQALTMQARETMQDKYSRKAEKRLQHPLLLHRYARLQENARTGQGLAGPR